MSQQKPKNTADFAEIVPIRNQVESGSVFFRFILTLHFVSALVHHDDGEFATRNRAPNHGKTLPIIIMCCVLDAGAGPGSLLFLCFIFSVFIKPMAVNANTVTHAPRPRRNHINVDA